MAPQIEMHDHWFPSPAHAPVILHFVIGAMVAPFWSLPRPPGRARNQIEAGLGLLHALEVDVIRCCAGLGGRRVGLALRSALQIVAIHRRLEGSFSFT